MIAACGKSPAENTAIDEEITSPLLYLSALTSIVWINLGFRSIEISFQRAWTSYKLYYLLNVVFLLAVQLLLAAWRSTLFIIFVAF